MITKISEKSYDKYRNPIATFRCFCGNIFIARIYDVNREHTNSCGCYALKVRANNLRKKSKKLKTNDIKKRDL